MRKITVLLIMVLSFVGCSLDMDLDFGNPLSFEWVVTPPDPPTLSFPSNGDKVPKDLMLSFSGAGDYFTIQVATDKIFNNLVFSIDSTAMHIQEIADLKSSKFYYWRVSATNSYGTSYWSETFTFYVI